MKEVLFATTNPAKIKAYESKLKEKNIKLITIKDINLNVKVEETGNNAIENAYLKAKTYYDLTHIPTIGMDNNLFIENIADIDQPGTHVRRINGKELDDEEMIVYYTNLVKRYKTKLFAKWVYGMVICDDKGKNEYSWSKDSFYFADKPSKNRNPGYPLDSIAIIPEFNKYLVDLTKEEKELLNKKNNTDKVIQFILKSVKE